MGWSGTPNGRTSLMRLVNTLTNLGKPVLLLHYDETRGFGTGRSIDIWWRGRSRNADLMLLLAHVISQHVSWAGARIRLLRVIHSEEGRAQTEIHMQQLLDAVRVSADPVVITAPADEPFVETVKSWSREADLTLLGMRRLSPEHQDDYGTVLQDLVSTIGTVLLVRSAYEEELLSAEE